MTLRNLQQARGVLSLSAPADSTALFLSGAYQSLEGFHQLSLSTHFSASRSPGNVSPPLPTVPIHREGPLQNKSSTLSSAAEKVQYRETGTTHWADADTAESVAEHPAPLRLGHRKAGAFVKHPVDATRRSQSYGTVLAVGDTSHAVGSLLTEQDTGTAGARICTEVPSVCQTSAWHLANQPSSPQTSTGRRP